MKNKYVEHRQLHSRTDKIRFLQDLQKRKATIKELLPYQIEMWMQYFDEPDIYINEKTGNEISSAEMDLRQKSKGDNIIFITGLHRSRHV
jgi:hypothetical protein